LLYSIRLIRIFFNYGLLCNYSVNPGIFSLVAVSIIFLPAILLGWVSLTTISLLYSDYSVFLYRVVDHGDTMQLDWPDVRYVVVALLLCILLSVILPEPTCPTGVKRAGRRLYVTYRRAASNPKSIFSIFIYDGFYWFDWLHTLSAGTIGLGLVFIFPCFIFLSIAIMTLKDVFNGRNPDRSVGDYIFLVVLVTAVIVFIVPVCFIGIVVILIMPFIDVLIKDPVRLCSNILYNVCLVFLSTLIQIFLFCTVPIVLLVRFVVKYPIKACLIALLCCF